MTPTVATPILDPITDVTRRELLAGMLALPLIGIACDDDDDGGSETRIVDDAFGRVEIPVDPRRYVAGDEITFGNMLALGIQPLGGAWYSAELAPHLQAAVKGDQPVNLVATGEFDLERALALDPDLLVTVDFDRDFCHLLKAATPTYCYQYGYVTREEIFDNLRGNARALGREDAAQELLDKYDERIAGLKKKVQDGGGASKPVAVVYASAPDTWYVIGQGVAAFVMQDLGIPRLEGFPMGEEAAISAERLGELDSAYAIVGYTSGSRPQSRAAIEASPLWPRLQAVEADRVLWVNGPAWYGYDMLAIFAVLDDIEQQLIPVLAK